MSKILYVASQNLLNKMLIIKTVIIFYCYFLILYKSVWLLGKASPSDFHLSVYLSLGSHLRPVTEQCVQVISPPSPRPAVPPMAIFWHSQSGNTCSPSRCIRYGRPSSISFGRLLCLCCGTYRDVSDPVRLFNTQSTAVHSHLANLQFGFLVCKTPSSIYICRRFHLTDSGSFIFQ